MPTTYETKTTTQSSSSIGLHLDYIRTVPGILKIVEIVVSIIVIITSSVYYWFTLHGGGWVQFVSITATLCTAFLFLARLFNFHHRLLGPWLLIEFIYYCVFTLFYLIAAIVAAVKGAWHDSVAATAFFAFAATAVYAVDTFFQFRAYRTGQTEMTTTTTTTTTTSRNVEAHHQTY